MPKTQNSAAQNGVKESRETDKQREREKREREIEFCLLHFYKERKFSKMLFLYQRASKPKQNLRGVKKDQDLKAKTYKTPKDSFSDNIYLSITY